ncbi:hypothetical protein [Clostridium tagluense]|uniref:Uncharacterized protein n=1 Tax=Clostridium tagluense TaxID=360422 RepID=A0A401UQ78_9CLOT|nr:hypothetical protein [Clostridium tagluense]GCD11676.1 hypothetical protein Ctaglu_32990 [Clostridium tagluense]
MKLHDKFLKLKDIEYYSYGQDSEDGENRYWYLQTASSGYEDYEIISSKHKFIPLVVGKIISFINNKRLVKW